jgi:putative FmdB family regulatory protein
VSDAASVRGHREDTMAVYEYTCKKCRTKFEVTCHMDEREAKAVCPKCGSRKVTQKLSAAFSSPSPPKY